MLDSLLQVLGPARQALGIPGGVVGTVSPGSGDSPVLEVTPFGVSDLELGRPVDPRTGFEIGSLTKLFTAVVLASVIDRPEPPLGLDTELRALTSGRVPGWDGEQITVADLVTHRAGLPKMPPNHADGPLERAAYRANQLWAGLAATRLQTRPGWAWAYSNFGFGLLGTVLSERTGRPFGALVDELVCRPLGLARTMLEPTAVPEDTGWTRWFRPSAPLSPAPGVATGYQQGGFSGRLVAASPWDNTGALAGSGGLISTGEDMTTFLAAAAGYGSGPVAAALARTRHYLPARGGPDRPRMGMAWQFRRTKRCGPVRFKNGGTSGMHCAMAVLPRGAKIGGGHGVVVLTNGPEHVDELTVDLLATMIGR